MAIAIFWFLFALAAILPVRWVVYLFFVGLTFGSFNTLPGGFNLTPYAATAPLLAVRLLGERGAGIRLGDALLTATAPALFPGVIIVGLNTNLETPLRYGMGNVSQAIYTVAAWLVTVSIYALIQRPGGRAILAQALLLGGACAVGAGVIDLVTAGSGLLAPLRTASYAIITSAEMGGLRRVIGFNTEASSYGALTLVAGTTLLFARPARFAGPLCRMVEPPLTIGLLVMCFLSTSSAAYLGLAAALVLYMGLMVARAVTASRSLEGHRATLTLAALVFVLWAGALVLMFSPSLADPVMRVVDQAVFQKAGSESFIERMSWSRVSMAAFMHSGGYGVGLGSTRASSFPVAVAAGCGVVGTALLSGFFARCLLASLAQGRPAHNATGTNGPGHNTSGNGADGLGPGGETLAHGWRQAIVGTRLAWLACLVPAISVATTVDMSAYAVFFAIMASAGTSLTAPGGAGQAGGGVPHRFSVWRQGGRQGGRAPSRRQAQMRAMPVIGCLASVPAVAGGHRHRGAQP